MRSQGFDPGNYADDRSAFQATLAANRSLQERIRQQEQLAQYGQQFLADQQRVARERQQQQAQNDPAARWRAPEWDTRNEQYLRADANGNITVVPGADPSLVPRYMAYQEHRRRLTDQFVQDPQAFLRQLAGEQQQVNPQQIAQYIDQRLQAVRDEEDLRQFSRTNAKWLYATDSAGTPIVDPVSKTYVWGPRGARFAQIVQQLEPHIQHQGTLRQAAMNQLLAEEGQGARATTSAIETGANLQQQLLNAGNTYQPNRSGTFAAFDNTGAQGPAFQNPQLSLRDQLRGNLQRDGFTDAHFR